MPYAEILSRSTCIVVYLVWTDYGMHNMLNHKLSGDEDWNLYFLPNLRIHDLGETSEGDSSDSGGGEGPAMLQSNYMDLHALHEY